MKFKELRFGDAFRFRNRLYIKLNLPVSSALDVKEGRGRVIRFNDEDEVENVVVDISIIRME